MSSKMGKISLRLLPIWSSVPLRVSYNLQDEVVIVSFKKNPVGLNHAEVLTALSAGNSTRFCRFSLAIRS